MPLKGTKKEKFDEFRHGNTFRRTAAKYGKTKARKQMVAAVLNSERGGKRKRKTAKKKAKK